MDTQTEIPQKYLDLAARINERRKELIAGQVTLEPGRKKEGIRRQIVRAFFEKRRAEGWSLQVAAKKLGISKSFLFRVESGQQKAPVTLAQKMIPFLD